MTDLVHEVTIGTNTLPTLTAATPFIQEIATPADTMQQTAFKQHKCTQDSKQFDLS